MEAEIFYVLDNCLNIYIHIQRKMVRQLEKAHDVLDYPTECTPLSL